MKPASYPLMAITKKYNVDYSDVLKHADRMLNDRGSYVFEPWTPIDCEIAKETILFNRIRDGEIDWLTGERK